MKHLAALFALLAVFAVQTFAGDAKHTYTGDITGVVCAACKAHVSEALTAKLPGVEKIDITKGEKEGVNTITIVSKDSNVTKDTAMAALGDLAQNYQITSLACKTSAYQLVLMQKSACNNPCINEIPLHVEGYSFRVNTGIYGMSLMIWFVASI